MVAKIRKIEATPSFTAQKKIRVAAYARVSTGSDEQLLSLETQKEHYDSFIKSHPEWEYAGLYYDEGISGTKVEKRDGLVMLLKDCEEGKIDRVITKSISRFSRNTTNTLEMVRNLSIAIPIMAKRICTFVRNIMRQLLRMRFLIRLRKL